MLDENHQIQIMENPVYTGLATLCVGIEVEYRHAVTGTVHNVIFIGQDFHVWIPFNLKSCSIFLLLFLYL